MKHVFALVALLALTGPTLAVDSVATLTGIATAKDGDGILFGKVEVRLQGIAAPEFNSRKKEPGGRESLDNLRALMEGKAVRCELDGTHARKRPVAVCFVGEIELGKQQVLAGHARDCKRFSKGRYLDAELVARASGIDLSTIYELPPYCRD